MDTAPETADGDAEDSSGDDLDLGAAAFVIQHGHTCDLDLVITLSGTLL